MDYMTDERAQLLDEWASLTADLTDAEEALEEAESRLNAADNDRQMDPETLAELEAVAEQALAAQEKATDAADAVIRKATSHIYSYSGVFRECDECGARETYWSDTEYFPDVCPSDTDNMPPAHLAPDACGWFLLCERPAAVAIPHPVLGKVNACHECAVKVEGMR